MLMYPGVAVPNYHSDVQLAELYQATGDHVRAIEILEPIAAAEPGNAQVRLQLALAYFASARLARAERELRALVERDPSDHYAHHILGRTLERQNRMPEALPHLRLAAAMAAVPDYLDAVSRVTERLERRGGSDT